jgi:hypothetical protein
VIPLLRYRECLPRSRSLKRRELLAVVVFVPAVLLVAEFDAAP